MSDFLLISLVAGVVAAIISQVSLWALSTRVSRLEFQISVLEERLLSEIKRRARTIAQKNQDFDADVLAAASKVQPEAKVPWWMALPKS
jgi:hypothetical protein